MLPMRQRPVLDERPKRRRCKQLLVISRPKTICKAHGEATGNDNYYGIVFDLGQGNAECSSYHWYSFDWRPFLLAGCINTKPRYINVTTPYNILIFQGSKGDLVRKFNVLVLNEHEMFATGPKKHQSINLKSSVIKCLNFFESKAQLLVSSVLSIPPGRRAEIFVSSLSYFFM